MPNRIIKESVCTSDSIDKLGWFEEVLFYRLMVSCDDYGRFDGRTAVVKNRLFPLKEALTMEEVSHALQRLSEVGLVRMYEVEGKPYLYLPTWEHHQTIRAKRSKYPVPGEEMNSSEIICKQMQADVAVIQSNPIQSESNPNPIRNTNIYGEEKKQKRKNFVKPTLEEVTEYINENMFIVKPEVFFDYYEANGWTIGGKGKMKDWKATIRNWDRREQEKKKPEQGEWAF